MGTALSEELANAQMVQEVKAKACVCTHVLGQKSLPCQNQHGLLLEPPLLPGRKGMILCLGSFCPPSIGNLSSICI